MNARYAWQVPLVVVIATSQAHKWREEQRELGFMDEGYTTRGLL
jgi:hypothetical protein